MTKTALVVLAVVAAIGAGVWYYQRSHFGGAAPSEAVRICAADFPEMPVEQVHQRCACVIKALEASDEGRSVLVLIQQNKQFLKTIESAASHGSVLDAMNVCGQ